MDDGTIADLKQFISATVGQHSSRLETKIDKLDDRVTRVEGRLTRVEGKLSDVEYRISDLEDTVHQMKVTTLDHVFTYTSTVDEQVQDHEKRLTKIKA